MTYGGALLIILACAAAAGVTSYVVSLRVPLAVRQRHHEGGLQVFQQIGVMFSVLLAFVFSEVWGQYNTAAQAINGECAALHGAAMLAAALPDHGGRPVDQAIAAYGRIVVRDEWPRMAERRRSARAEAAFDAIMDAAASLAPARPAEVAVHGQILAQLAQAHAERETRAFQITRSLPDALWTVLIVLSLFLIWSVLFAGIEPPGHVIFAVALTGCTVMVLVLVRMLDFPFEGALTLSNADFAKMTAEVSALVASP